MPSATISSMSGYFAASAIAAELMAPSQPWSAAGPEKPMVMVSPVASLPSTVGASSELPESSGVPEVQPVSRAATASDAPAVMSSFLLIRRVASMYFLLGK